MQTTTSPAASGNVPKTVKVKMPDGTFKVKVQQLDGSWRWQKPPKQAPTTIKSMPTPAAGITAPSPSQAPGIVNQPESKATADNHEMAILPKSKPKKKPAVNIGRAFKAATLLDAVLPEHLKIGSDLRDEIHHSDNDDDNDDNSSTSSRRSSNGKADKDLAKFAAGGVKVKVKKAKKSVYRSGEVGSSDEEDLDEKHPSSSNDDIATMKEKSYIHDNMLDKKQGMKVTERELPSSKKKASKGRPLHQRSSRLAKGIAWAIALFFPLFFLILAVINASMDKKNASQYIVTKSAGNTGNNTPNSGGEDTTNHFYKLGSRLLEANKLCVSIWPILFGAIVAQSLRMLAAFRVERSSGMALVQLEQFVGSHSLATAIKQPFMMMHLDLTAVGMICLWALSPIAGQSFLRMLTVEPQSVITSATNVTFADFSRPMAGLWNTTDDSATAAISILFATALLATPANSPSNMLADLESDPWQQPTTVLMGYPRSGQPWPEYTPYSLVGQSIYNVTTYDEAIETSQAVNFTLPTSWFSFQCNDPVNRTLESYYGEPGLNSSEWFSDGGDTMFMANVLPNGTQSGSNGLSPATLYLAMSHTREDNYTLFTPEMAVWQCEYFTQYATINYTCVDYGTNCTVAYSDEAPDYGYPHLEPNGTNIYLTDEFVLAWITSLGLPDSLRDNGNSSTSSNSSVYSSPSNSSSSTNSSDFDFDYEYTQRSLLAQYLIDPNWLMDHGDNPNPSTVPGALMQQKLTSTITAYWQLGFTYTTFDPPYEVNTTNVPNISKLKLATITDWSARYIVHWQWLTVLVCSCILLLVFGITGIILDSRTIGPDILGFASSMTRDNRYIKLEDEAIELDDEAVEGGSSAKSGYQTIHDLKYHRVMLQDVHGDADVGKVALGSVGLQHGKPLSRDRLYR